MNEVLLTMLTFIARFQKETIYFSVNGFHWKLKSTPDHPVEKFALNLYIFTEFRDFYPQKSKKIEFCNFFSNSCLKIISWTNWKQFRKHSTVLVSQVEKSLMFYHQFKKVSGNKFLFWTRFFCHARFKWSFFCKSFRKRMRQPFKILYLVFYDCE